MRSHLHPPRDGWQNGHLYKKHKLRQVLCAAHGGIFPVVLAPISFVVGPMIVAKRPRHARPEFPALRFIGFWSSTEEYTLPNPALYVDAAWNSAERAAVAAYLRSAPVVEHWMGSSTCRICNLHPLGSADQCDGVYLWPEGFAHYVERHAVKPPPEFLAHTLRPERT